MLFPLVIWLTALVVAGFFAIRRWWFPVAINAHAVAFDSYFSLNLIVIGAVFLAAQITLGWFVWKFRDTGGKARFSGGNYRLEVIWTLITLVLFLGGAAASARMWSDVHLDSSPRPAIRIELAGKQFAWSVRYPGADGKFGRTDVRLANDATGNPFGIDEKDVAGSDDIVGSAVRVPAGVPVELLLKSHDVIHNFFVRELRIKQDVVPGMEIPLRFQADRPGEYELACSELCGLGHHQMRSVLIVMGPAEFEDWLKGQRK